MTCAHYWEIPSYGLTVTAKCQKCGATKEFVNYAEEGLDNKYSLHAQKMTSEQRARQKASIRKGGNHSKIPVEDFDIINARYENGETQESIASDYGVTRKAMNKFICRMRRERATT